MSKSRRAPLRETLDVPDEVVTGITHGELRRINTELGRLQRANELLTAELETTRRELCTFCANSAGRWSPAERKARKNGRLIRWQHLFDGEKDNAALCEAWKSREREFQREKKKPK